MACILMVPWLGLEQSILVKTYIVNICFRKGDQDVGTRCIDRLSVEPNSAEEGEVYWECLMAEASAGWAFRGAATRPMVARTAKDQVLSARVVRRTRCSS